MRNDTVLEKIITRVLCSIILFFFEKRAVYEIMWKNTAQRGRPQMTMWRTRWITQTTNTHTHTHSEYVTLTGLPLQQWLNERPSMLRYTYIACIILVFKVSIPIYLLQIHVLPLR
jgi:hypothetical protein